MAGSTAVPGFDPSRVSTPAELAACLNGLRLRRGLSYEAMERAAAKLLSRPDRSRLEPLPKSTVGEIVTGTRLPAIGKLLTFLAVCEVARADLAQWQAAWERASTADLARPAGAVRVRDALPRRLGVHDAIQVEEKVPGELPVYVPRDIDDRLRAELEANAQRGCFVLLIGGSSVGKTRTLYEAVLAALPDWWLVHPAGPGEVTALAAAPPARTVVWLDELQRYLDGEGGLAGGVVRALLDAPGPVLLIGTLWPDRYHAYTALPAPGGPDLPAREREVLGLAAVIRIGAEFSPAEQGRARAAAAHDRRLALALGAEGYGLTQTLAAAPQLVGRWQDARAADPYGWAVLTAALDVARLGARAPLTAGLLQAAAPGYCTSAQQAEAPQNWFERALVYATEKLYGAAVALAPAGSGAMGQVAGYTVADYLLQHASRERRNARVPAATWDAILSHVRDPADAFRIADSAEYRLLYCYAVPLFRRALDAGDRDAASRLAQLMDGRGDLDGGTAQILRACADAGDGYAAMQLAELLAERGNLDGAVQILVAGADAGDQDVAGELARLLAERGDLDQLRARADAGDGHAARELARLLAERGDLDQLRARADADDRDAAHELVRQLAGRGDLDQLRTRADAGDENAAGRLADLLAERGDLDQLRARADAGDRAAASRLAVLLAGRGDLDGTVQILCACADAGDRAAAGRLAVLLARRGDLDQLRSRAAAGDWPAARQLAGLLARHGDPGGAAQILRARVDAGDPYAAEELAGQLARHGDLDGAVQVLRTRADADADAGDGHATRELARLLAERGDLDQLRARADADDRDAAHELVRQLAGRGDLDQLRTRANAGDENAAGRLADLLAERGNLDEAVQILRSMANPALGGADRLAKLLTRQGRGEEAERLRRFGLNPDGSTADG